MQHDLISVIVPVYKVEQYLEKCVKSLLLQTYTNLEIILVDDGSPDQCGEMCDNFAREDCRIKVIHKQNGGLSDARNAGLDIAKGEYIGFVDSDDWIDPQMYEMMLDAMYEYQADMSICCIDKIRSDGHFVQDIGHDRIYSRQKALYELILDKNVNSFAWNKLYHRKLFSNSRYPKGKIFEDTLFTYQLMQKVTRVVHVNRPLYHYVRRDDSILGTWPPSIELEFCLAQQERYSKMSRTHDELMALLSRKYMERFWNLRRNFLKTNDDEARRCSQRIKKEIAPFFMAFKKIFFASEQFGIGKYISTIFYLNAPMVYRRIYSVFKQNH